MYMNGAESEKNGGISEGSTWLARSVQPFVVFLLQREAGNLAITHSIHVEDVGRLTRRRATGEAATWRRSR